MMAPDRLPVTAAMVDEVDDVPGSPGGDDDGVDDDGHVPDVPCVSPAAPAVLNATPSEVDDGFDLASVDCVLSVAFRSALAVLADDDSHCAPVYGWLLTLVLAVFSFPLSVCAVFVSSLAAIRLYTAIVSDPPQDSLVSPEHGAWHSSGESFRASGLSCEPQIHSPPFIKPMYS